MRKRRAPTALYAVLIAAYLGCLLYLLTLRPGGALGSNAVIWILTGFTSGGMIMMALYTTTLYLFRHGERAMLYFALFCVGSGVRFLVMDGSMTLMALLTSLPLEMALCIRFAAIGLQVIGFTSFVFGLFAGARHKKKLKYLNFLTAAGFAVSAASSAIAGEDLLSARLTLFLWYLFIDGYCIFIVIFSGSLRKNRLHILYFISMLIYAGSSMTAALMSDRLPHLAVISSTVFVVVHIILLSDRYDRAIRDAELWGANLERIVSERTSDLQSINDAMRELIGNISHDLKTPLTAMSVNLEKLLEITPGDENYSRYIRIAYHKNLDLHRLIQNMLDVSRIEAGQSSYKPEWSSLNSLLSAVSEKYGEYLESEGLTLDVTSGGTDGGDPLIYTDPVKIWSVFDNLIYNAVRHTESGGINVTAEVKGATAAITVSDTGCGIAPEHLPRIFERFYKTSSDRGARAGDSGVGLYIVKSVMEGCGGTVDVLSESGKGTSFILTFEKKTENEVTGA